MDNKLEVIHHEMEETRASLAGKLDSLENHVLGTVHEATDAVSHTVADVKSAVGSVTGTIEDTVKSVADTFKHTFDMSDHVKNHPWGMLCGAVAVGFAGGSLLPSSRREKEEAPRATASPLPVAAVSASNGASAARAAAPAEHESSGAELLHKLKGLALGTLMGVVRDLVATALPESVKGDVTRMVDDFTIKLGAKPVSDPLGTESSAKEQASTSGGQAHDEREHATSDGARESAAETAQRSGGGKRGQQSRGGFDRPSSK